MMFDKLAGASCLPLDIRPATSGHQMSVVRRCRIRHRPIATRKQMTQIVRQRLQIIDINIRIVVQHAIFGGPSNALNRLMRHQIEMRFVGMHNVCVDDGASRHIVVLRVADTRLAGKEASVMTLLHNDHGDLW